MTFRILNLPPEIRLNIYSHVFSTRIALIEAGTQEEYPSLIPSKTVQPLGSCSGQFLRVCKQIQREAEPMLYARTHFYVLTQAFAGKLPQTLTGGCLFAPKITSMTWQLNCDLMKHFYFHDFSVCSQELTQLNNLELRCQAEAWKDSFMGEWVDRASFVRGREQVIQYALKLQSLMNQGSARKTYLVEDSIGLSKGRVVLRLTRKKRTLAQNERLINWDLPTEFDQVVKQEAVLIETPKPKSSEALQNFNNTPQNTTSLKHNDLHHH